MIKGLEAMVVGLGMQFETVLLIVFGFAGIILFALGFKRGLILNLLIFTIITTAEYAQGMDFTKSLVVMLLLLVLMAFSLYSTKQTTEGII